MKKFVKSKKLNLFIIIMLMLSLLFFTATTSAAPCYLVTYLDTLGGSEIECLGINNSGQVVGRSSIMNSEEPFHAFLYSGGTMIDLGALIANDYHSMGNGINDVGQVAGWLNFGKGPKCDPDRGIIMRPFLYSSTSGWWTILGTLGGDCARAHGINNSGWIVGSSDILPGGGNTAVHAFLYSGGTMTDLNTLGGSSSWGYGINDSGWVVGESHLPGDTAAHAFLYSEGTMTDLNTLGGSYSVALGINNSGWVVGDSDTNPDWYGFHAFLYDGTTMHDLGTLGGDNSWGYGINDSGWVVGASRLPDNDTVHAFLYDGTTMYDLNNLIPPSSGWVLGEARSINDYGQITGTGRFNGYSYRAFLLTPGAYITTADTNVPISIGLQITLTFNDIVSSGTVTAGMVPEWLPAPVNFEIVNGSQYNIISEPSFSFIGQVTVCIKYDPARITVSEDMLSVRHYNGNDWEPSLEMIPVDTVNKIVCGVFNSLSPVAVVQPKYVYGFDGFFSPVDNLPTVNNAKAGQAIPVKWRLTDADGTPVSDPASFKSLTSYSIGCNDFLGDPADSVEEYAAGASGLQYMGDGVWQYNWKTPKTHAGQCRTMVLTLGDGSTHKADFKFK